MMIDDNLIQKGYWAQLCTNVNPPSAPTQEVLQLYVMGFGNKLMQWHGNEGTAENIWCCRPLLLSKS
jgi:hypothetical protein